MRNFKYVKFSRSTAKQNPQMIIDAYNKLIDQTTEKLQDFNKRKHTININVYGTIGNELVQVRRELTQHKVSIEVNALQIIQLYNKIIEQEKKSIELTSELEDIQRELVTFQKRFTDNFNSFYAYL